MNIRYCQIDLPKKKKNVKLEIGYVWNNWV